MSSLAVPTALPKVAAPLSTSCPASADLRLLTISLVLAQLARLASLAASLASLQESGSVSENVSVGKPAQSTACMPSEARPDPCLPCARRLKTRSVTQKASIAGALETLARPSGAASYTALLPLSSRHSHTWQRRHQSPLYMPASALLRPRQATSETCLQLSLAGRHHCCPRPFP